MTTYSFPVAALFAATMVYGRLSSDNELTGCRAGGISYLSMMSPAFVLGLGVAGVSLLFLCFVVPVYSGADQGLASPLIRNVAQNLAKSKYHQNFYDQSLGPSVGRVVNDVTAEIAGGSMTPEAAAKAIQDAYKQGN